MTVSATWTNPGPGGALDFAAGQLIQETHMDAISSNFFYQFGSTGNGPWTAWTPTMTQSVGVAVSVNYAEYAKVGKIAIVQMYVNITGTGSAGSGIIIGAVPSSVIPPRRTGSFVFQGSAVFIDSSDANRRYHLGIVVPNSTEMHFINNNQTGNFGAAPSLAAASGDALSLFAMWEIA